MSKIRIYKHFCSLLVVLFLFILVVGSSENKSSSSSTKSQSQVKWYNGGTLHKAGALEWQNSSYPNKLATCADFITKLHQDGALTDSVSSKINSVDDIRPFAEELVKALDEAFKKSSNSDKNRRLYANQTVAGTALILLKIMGWLK
jgi:hypothetical protein